MAEQTVTQDGLIYKLSEDGTYYTVEIPSELGDDITIENHINGIPVVYDSLDYANSKYAKTFISEPVGLASDWGSSEQPEGYEEFYRDGALAYYKYEDNSHCLVVWDKETEVTEATILSEVNGVPVTKIAFRAFSGCTSLTSITIPDSVTSIEDSAFISCSALTSVTIGNGVTSIGSNAFYSCSALTSIIIPDSVTTIRSQVFRYCSALTSVTIGNSVTSISDYAFYECSKLTSINIPDSVTSIGDRAFQECSKLTSVTIPDSVTSIGEYAFRNCSELTSINIPDGVTSIERNTFGGCKALTSIDIPNSVTSIGNSAFINCTSLTSIDIPDNVTSLQANAFSGCSGLTSVTIGNGITSIGRNTFGGCTSLTSITIPNGITSIGNTAFSGCTSLKTVILGKRLETLYGTDIYSGSFLNCTALTTVINRSDNLVTPNNNYPFYGCSYKLKVYYTSTTAGYVDGGIWCNRIIEYLNWPDDQSFMLNATVTDSFNVTNKTTVNVKEKMNYKLRYTITDTNGNRYIGDVPIGKYYLYDNTTNTWVLFPQ